MSIFKLHEAVIDDYGKYIQIFFSIADERIRQFVEEALLKRRELWPDVLVQADFSAISCTLSLMIIPLMICQSGTITVF